MPTQRASVWAETSIVTIFLLCFGVLPACSWRHSYVILNLPSGTRGPTSPYACPVAPSAQRRKAANHHLQCCPNPPPAQAIASMLGVVFGCALMESCAPAAAARS